MFRVRPVEQKKTFRPAIVALLTFSLAALAITVWVMVDFLTEQEIVRELMKSLPLEAREKAQALAGELRWQFRLSILVVLNLVVTACAVVLLSRAYRSSQASLRDVKALAADILSSMDQAVVTTDVAGRVTSINRRARELLGVADACLDHPVGRLHAELPLEDFRQEALANGQTPETRDFTITCDDSRRILRGFCQSLQDDDGKEIGSVLQLRDVTERVLIDDRLRRMERYMGLGSLAAGLHHEIRNPLAALSLHVQLLEEQFDAGSAPEEVLQMLAVIKSEVARVSSVLEGFRDFAAVNRLNPAEVDLSELVRRQVELLTPRAERQHVQVRVQNSSEPVPPVVADYVRLEQVLLNLFINALEAMADGGILTVRTTALPDAVRVEISDTGPGIPDDLQERIFDPYFTTKSDGTGLGLALCDKIMRQHQGSLDYHSTKSGTTFIMTLPMTTVSIASSGRPWTKNSTF